MPLLLQKHRVPHRYLLRDVRPVSQRLSEEMSKPDITIMVAFSTAGAFMWMWQPFAAATDLLAMLMGCYFWWASKQPFKLGLKFPKYANIPDPNNPTPGKPGAGKSDGILYLGNSDDPEELTASRELWITNTDARTHILYLGTTGSGKTEGLKGLVTNALAWGSGFVYVDGKADTDLWASLYSVVRRFGRDDDIFALNYMTGNSDAGSVSNSMNPFSNGSSSYLANMIVSFMPDAGGDNAMWKERATALMFTLMPALTYKRDHQGFLLDIGVVRDHIELQPVIRLSRDPNLPERVTHGLKGYLNTLPGYVDAAFDDDGNERPPSPDQPMYDLQVARQQHGYLSMQFTRSLQMMADEYGYIFKAQLADIDVLDVVLNRRILVTLVPALEKALDEAANLGKIVAASLKGMMGMTLGNTVEGSWEGTVGSKQTRSASPFMTVFDEVGYYTAPGMAVMAAQARSLGFALVFASQDLPAMEKRVKAEAKSIVGNCNLKIYGRIEDPTDTMDFIGKHTQNDYVMETTGMKAPTNTVSSIFMTTPFYDDRNVKIEKRIKFDGDHLKQQREGEVHWTFAELFGKARMFFVDVDKADALRVHRLLPVPPTTSSTAARERAMHELTAKLKDDAWTAASSANAAVATSEIASLARNFAAATAAHRNPLEAGAVAVAGITTLPAPVKPEAPPEKTSTKAGAGIKTADQQSRAETSSIPEISLAEKTDRRAGMPSFYEGDQYAIDELEQQQTTTAKAAPRQQVSTGESAGASAGFASTDADLSVVVPTEAGDEGSGVMDVKLPDDIVALLEQSAAKLNKGLAGSDSR
jgi:intracellular multiplication protein IcmO